MTAKEIADNVSHLPPQELSLFAQWWESNGGVLLAEGQASEWQLSEEQKALLRRRREDYRQNPAAFPKFEPDDFDLMVRETAVAYDKKTSSS